MWTPVPHAEAAVDLGTAPVLRSVAHPRWLPKACIVAADVAAIVLTMVLAYVVRSALKGWDATDRNSRHLLLGAVSLPFWVVLFSHYKLYTARFVTNRLDEFGRIMHAAGTSVIAMVAMGFMLKLYVSRSWLLFTFLIGVVLITAEREAVRRAFKAMRRRGRLFRPVIVVGANAEALSLCGLLAENQWLGYRVLGVVDDQAAVGSQFHGQVPVLGPISDVLDLARQTGVTGVVVATTAVSTETSNRLARQLTDAGIHVELSSSLKDIAAERLTVSPLGRCPMIYVQPIRRNGWRAAAKRAFDIVVAATALVVAAPLLVVVAVAIKVDTRGPVLFRQQRLGRNGEPFSLLKFRTMVTVAEELIVNLRTLNQADGPLFKIRDDPRVTRVGRILRKYSIDELPQLWNVLRGEMSLVGPRPALPAEMAAWAPELHNRLRVKPGVTGMWQVSGRSDCSFAEYMRLDLYYVDNWSFWSDLAIVAKTVPTVLLRRGAY